MPSLTTPIRWSALIGARRALLGLVAGLLVAATVVAATWRVSGLGDALRWWAAPVALLLGAACGASIVPVRRAVRMPGVLPVANACSAAAVYGCVPETDQMTFVGAACAVVVVLEVVRWRPLPVVWHASVAALVLWSGLYGATGRPSALIGALFAGLPVPLLGGWLLVRPRLASPVAAIVLAIASVAAVAMARTGGIELTGTRPAARWLLVWLSAAVAASGVVVFSAGRGGRRGR